MLARFTFIDESLTTLFASSVDQPLCSHMSAPGYFAESISSDVGFWGIRCENYFDFLIGRCGDVSLDEEDSGDEEDSLFKKSLRRIDGMPQETGSRPAKMQWQLMGAHCSDR